MVIPIKLDRKGGDAPFNMAQLFYFRLNQLLGHKSQAKITGDIEGWFKALVEIHTQISFQLNKDDNEKILDLLQQCRRYIYSPMPRNKRQAVQMQALIGGKVTGWLNELDLLIMKKMSKYKMIFPRIEVRSPMDQLKDDMGLPGLDQ